MTTITAVVGPALHGVEIGPVKIHGAGLIIFIVLAVDIILPPACAACGGSAATKKKTRYELFPIVSGYPFV